MTSPAGRLLPLSPEHRHFLSERFQKVEGVAAAPGHRGRYAVVRQGQEVLGLVAVDDELEVWCSPCAEDKAALRRQGFSHSPGNLLACLYFDLPFAALPPPVTAERVPAAAQAAVAPRPPVRVPRLEESVLAGAGAQRASEPRSRQAVVAQAG